MHIFESVVVGSFSLLVDSFSLQASQFDTTASYIAPFTQHASSTNN